MLQKIKDTYAEYSVDLQDRKQGLYLAYYPDLGERYQLQYLDGKLHGECKVWHNDKLITHVCIHSNISGPIFNWMDDSDLYPITASEREQFSNYYGVPLLPTDIGEVNNEQYYTVS